MGCPDLVLTVRWAFDLSLGFFDKRALVCVGKGEEYGFALKAILCVVYCCMLGYVKWLVCIASCRIILLTVIIVYAILLFVLEIELWKKER